MRKKLEECIQFLYNVNEILYDHVKISSLDDYQQYPNNRLINYNLI